ncbi:hypothetical protein D9M71_696460 [compost metagenome]
MIALSCCVDCCTCRARCWSFASEAACAACVLGLTSAGTLGAAAGADAGAMTPTGAVDAPAGACVGALTGAGAVGPPEPVLVGVEPVADGPPGIADTPGMNLSSFLAASAILLAFSSACFFSTSSTFSGTAAPPAVPAVAIARNLAIRSSNDFSI